MKLLQFFKTIKIVTKKNFIATSSETLSLEIQFFNVSSLVVSGNLNVIVKWWKIFFWN